MLDKVVINESMLEEIVSTVSAIENSKQGFGDQEPIDPTELRDIPLAKIKDLNVYEKEILKNTLYQESVSTAGQDLSKGDLVVALPAKNYSISYTAGTSSLAFGQSTADLYEAQRVDCGAGMVVDSITVSLRKSWSPTGTLSCVIWTGLSEDAPNWDETTGQLAETSSTTFNVATQVTGSFQDFTFNFAGNFYEGNIFFKIGTGAPWPTDFFYVEWGSSTTNHERFQTLKVDTSTDPDEWNEVNAINFSIEWDFPAWLYKGHWDWFDRTIDPMEVMEDVSSGGTVKLNVSNMFYNQTWLTVWERYYIDYDWTLTTTATYNPIGYALSTTTIRQLPPTPWYKVIQGTYSIASLPSEETYTHNMWVPPRGAIMWAGSQSLIPYKVGVRDGADNGTSFDQDYASADENAAFIFKDYDSGGGDYITAKVTGATDTDITIDWAEGGTYWDTGTIYFTMLLIA